MRSFNISTTCRIDAVRSAALLRASRRSTVFDARQGADPRPSGERSATKKCARAGRRAAERPKPIHFRPGHWHTLMHNDSGQSMIGQQLQQFSRELAGAAGFEPANGGIKSRCLTTWRRPTGRRPYSGASRCEKPRSPLPATMRRGGGASRADRGSSRAGSRPAARASAS